MGISMGFPQEVLGQIPSDIDRKVGYEVMVLMLVIDFPFFGPYGAHDVRASQNRAHSFA